MIGLTGFVTYWKAVLYDDIMREVKDVESYYILVYVMCDKWVSGECDRGQKKY